MPFQNCGLLATPHSRIEGRGRVVPTRASTYKVQSACTRTRSRCRGDTIIEILEPPRNSVHGTRSGRPTSAWDRLCTTGLTQPAAPAPLLRRYPSARAKKKKKEMKGAMVLCMSRNGRPNIDLQGHRLSNRDANTPTLVGGPRQHPMHPAFTQRQQHHHGRPLSVHRLPISPFLSSFPSPLLTTNG